MSWKRVFCVGVVLASCLGFLLPSAWTSVVGSPDETAVAEAAHALVQLGSFRMDDARALAFPWLHPRSYVTVNAHRAPVGFLGWSFVLAIPRALGGVPLAGVCATLLTLTGLIPLYRLLRRYGETEAWLGVWVYATFPAWLLYTNRALFPNAIVCTGMLWGTWFLSQAAFETLPRGRRVYDILVGALLALTLAIRPVEVLWILPWWVLAVWHDRTHVRRFVSYGIGALCAWLPLAWLASRTYDGWGLIGYWLRDPLNSGTDAVGTFFAQSQAPASVAISVFPFGFHVFNVLWNIRAFFFGPLFAWVGVGVAACAWLWRARHRDAVLAVCAWTALVLVSVYGQGRYADHIAGSIAMGNSFIRYTLPLGGVLAVLVARCTQLITVSRQRTVVFVSTLLLGCFGFYQVLCRDDESLLRARVELQRYAFIRAEAMRVLDPQTVVVSDRSDKIFFPQFSVASPIPPIAELARLSATRTPIALFARPLSQTELDAYGRYGFIVEEVGFFGRETLYLLMRMHPV